VRLGALIGGGGAGELAALVIHVIMPLARAIDAIGPMEAGVEPLRAVGRAHLAGQHVAHFVHVGAGIGLGGKIAALPAPVCPGAGEAVKHLAGAGFAAVTLFFREFGQCLFIGHRAPQELRNTLFTHALQARRHARLAEIFLRDHVRRHLRPYFHVCLCPVIPGARSLSAVCTQPLRTDHPGRGKEQPSANPALCRKCPLEMRE